MEDKRAENARTVASYPAQTEQEHVFRDALRKLVVAYNELRAYREWDICALCEATGCKDHKQIVEEFGSTNDLIDELAKARDEEAERADALRLDAANDERERIARHFESKGSMEINGRRAAQVIRSLTPAPHRG